MAFLRELGTEPAKRFELSNSTLIGRDATCNIALDDPLVSRTHCEIRRGDDGRFVLVDLGSTHGTFVATTRIDERALEDGDTITVGATRLRFELPLKRFATAPLTITTETQRRRCSMASRPRSDLSEVGTISRTRVPSIRKLRPL